MSAFQPSDQYSHPYYSQSAYSHNHPSEAVPTVQAYPVAAPDVSYSASSFSKMAFAVELVLFLALTVAYLIPYWLVMAFQGEALILAGLWYGWTKPKGWYTDEVSDTATWVHVVRYSGIVACVFTFIAAIQANRVRSGASSKRMSHVVMLYIASIAGIIQFAVFQSKAQTSAETVWVPAVYFGASVWLQVAASGTSLLFAIFAHIKERSFLAVDAPYAALEGY